MITLIEKIKNRKEALESKEPFYDFVCMVSKDKRTLIKTRVNNVENRISQGYSLLKTSKK